MIRYIPAYCSMSHLEEITLKSLIDFVSPETASQAHTQIDMLDLIANGLAIKTDEREETVMAIAEKNPYIKHLIKNNRIDTGIEEFREIRGNAADYFGKQPKDLRIYLTSSMLKAMNQSFREESGSIFLSPDEDRSILFAEELETFKGGEQKEWSFTKRFFKPHHSLIIADPYIYKNIKDAISFMKEVVPKRLKCSYHLTLIGKAETLNMTRQQAKDAFNRVMEELNKIELDLTAEYFIYDKPDFHDRYLITNNCCIFPGSGIDILNAKTLNAKKEGTWIAFKPFKRINAGGEKGVFFYKLLSEKLEVMKKWIANSGNDPEGNASVNPLFHL